MAVSHALANVTTSRNRSKGRVYFALQPSANSSLNAFVRCNDPQTWFSQNLYFNLARNSAFLVCVDRPLYPHLLKYKPATVNWLKLRLLWGLPWCSLLYESSWISCTNQWTISLFKVLSFLKIDNYFYMLFFICKYMLLVSIISPESIIYPQEFYKLSPFNTIVSTHMLLSVC